MVIFVEKVNYYLKIFLLGSVIGYIFETVLKILVNPDAKNGILYGPWIPIYGFGCMIIIALMRLIFNRTNFNRITKIILTFVSVAVVITILEYLGGFLIEKLFHKVFWDYTKMYFNIGKYASLEMSLVWGILSLVFIYIIKPVEEKIIKKIPNYVFYMAFFIFILDVIGTSLKLYK